MYLTYAVDENGKRVYSLQKLNGEGKPNEVAHPARFSPEDKFSRERLIMKKRYGLLLMSKPKTEY